MKKILTVLLCSILLQANAQTYVSGLILTNTTWTKANSPYIVNGNLNVDSAVTLTIEPGVTIRVDSTYFFYVDGRILAEGTATDSIIFTANTVNPTLHKWEGIEFREKSRNDTSILKYCRIEYANIALELAGVKILIDSSVLRYNKTAVMVEYVQTAFHSFFIMNGSTITENTDGIKCYNFPIGKLTGCEISHNSTGYYDRSYTGLIIHKSEFNYNQTAIEVENTNRRDSLKITESIFKGNTMYGIIIHDPWNYKIYGRQPEIISDNLFIYNATAIKIEDVEAFTINRNTIAYNDIGIEHDQNYSVAPTRLYIDSNCFTNNQSYNYYEVGIDDDTLANNWWGTTSTAGIDSGIFDYYDNFSSGKIYYMPILTNGSGCQSVSPPPPCADPDSVVAKAISTTTANVTWPAVAGAVKYELYYRDIPNTSTYQFLTVYDTSRNLPGLVPGKTYSVCVRTKCTASPFLSNYVCDTFTMPHPPCDSPANIAINQVSTNNATISWSAVSKANFYEYYISPHPSTPPSNTTATTNTTIFLYNLTPNTTYDFCVRSNCNNSSSWSCDTLRTPTGINSTHLDQGVRIYPNPNNGTFNVSLDNNLVKNAALTVYDITGRIVVAKQNITTDETISISDVTKGIYIIRLQSDKAVINRRVIVE